MPTLVIPPAIDGDEIASMLRAMKKQMSILEMQRVSGVDRQVLYRIMGGTSINRTPYELVGKIMHFLCEHYKEEVGQEVECV
ncbi:MAG: hypothetical protein K0S20_607 [Patescibacteria group bacterium]|jgi:hypothetical protein|nr:hypothetical protein [Patescibacteria group bacterium]